MAISKKSLLTAVVGLAAISATGIAVAGQKATAGNEVSINTASRWARGALGYVRNTPNTNEFIGCYVETGASATPTVFCSARNNAATPVNVSCLATGNTLAQALNSLNGDSYVIFAWNSSGTCTSIEVMNYSTQAPKVL